MSAVLLKTNFSMSMCSVVIVYLCALLYNEFMSTVIPVQLCAPC